MVLQMFQLKFSFKQQFNIFLGLRLQLLKLISIYVVPEIIKNNLLQRSPLPDLKRAFSVLEDSVPLFIYCVFLFALGFFLSSCHVQYMAKN